MVGRGANRYLLARKQLPLTYSGGDQFIRKFRRNGLDATMYGNGAAIVALNVQTGLAPTWLALGPTTADAPTAPTLGELGAATQFALSDMIDFSQLANLFNEYQIHKIELHFQMDNAHAYCQGNGSNPNTIPSVYLRYDGNDSTLPAVSNVVQGAADTQYHSLAKPFTFTFYPKCSVQTFSNGVLPSYAAPASTRALWLDTTSPSFNTPHYGVKMWWRNFNYASAVGLSVRIQPTFYVAFRGVR